MQPLIGITTHQGKDPDGYPTTYLLQAYLQAILQAGGIPLPIPSLLAEGEWEALYPHLDGLLFSGGGDIAVERFGGEAHPRLDGLDPQRDALELNLLRAATSDGKPFLGICRGCQLVNVGLGGSLYTHLPDQLPGALHHSYPRPMRRALAHEVKIMDGTRLAEIAGQPRLKVNSLHHQGLKGVAPGLRVAALAPDGLVEAIELPDHPFGLAVQWHPEWLMDQSPMRRLFETFVHAARQRGHHS